MSLENKQKRSIAVIPAHDESAHVGDVVARALRHLDEVVVVDDGSQDDTAAKAEAAGAHVVRLVPNQGKGAALARGLAEALARGATQVVTLDADGEHDPEDVPALLAALSDADVVLGTRALYRSGARRAMNHLALFWFRLLDPQIEDTICGFRAFRADALPQVQNAAQGFAYEHEVILRALQHGLRLKSVAIRTTPRAGSHVTTRHIVQANNHFDRFVLRELGSFRIGPFRKALLAAGCATGLVLGEAALRVVPERRARRDG